MVQENDTLLWLAIDYVLTLTIFLVSNLVISITEFGSLQLYKHSSVNSTPH